MWFTPDVRRILAYSKPVDLRKSIDGLVGLVKSVLAEDPLSGSLFVFVNRRGNYMKLVSWDRTGWCLFAKRLEHGRFHFPHAEAKQELSVQVFQLLLESVLKWSIIHPTIAASDEYSLDTPWLHWSESDARSLCSSADSDQTSRRSVPLPTGAELLQSLWSPGDGG